MRIGGDKRGLEVVSDPTWKQKVMCMFPSAVYDKI